MLLSESYSVDVVMSGCGQRDVGKGNEPWVKNTLIYRQWEAMRQEILLHKWYESERAGYDIGWDRAVVDWMIKYGRVRRSEQPRDKQSA